ncbi:MAG: hypothetical protein ACE3JP_16595 [Ectobacillus sp.]
MGFYNGFCGGGYYNDGYNNVAGAQDNSIVRFLRQLSPGTRVTLQYNDRPPSTGIFQGFQNGNVILSNFDGFPGLVRISVREINAVSPH